MIVIKLMLEYLMISMVLFIILGPIILENNSKISEYLLLIFILPIMSIMVIVEIILEEIRKRRDKK